jgi:hypothetical protein
MQTFKQIQTERGFSKVVFTDTYNHQCSIQQSSLATEDRIWLGIESPDPQIMKSDALKLGLSLPEGEISGWTQYPIPKEVLISTQMHLNREQVKGLVEHLSKWLETGDFTQATYQQHSA